MNTQLTFKNIVQWCGGRFQKTHLWYRQRRQKRISLRAYRTFARQYPRWAESFFDEYFLANVLRIPRDCQSYALPTADELTVAWASQFYAPVDLSDRPRYNTTRSIAAAYLAYLESECGCSG